MHDLARSITAPVVVAVGLMLSSCVGAAVETSLVPHDRGAALADSATLPAGAPLFYAQATTSLSTTSNMDQAIPGMAITLPAATTSGHHALVTFSASVTYPQSPAACNFTIYIGSKKTSATGTTYDPSVSISNIPITIVERILLTSTPQNISVDWNNGGGGRCFLERFYSLSGLVTS